MTFKPEACEKPAKENIIKIRLSKVFFMIKVFLEILKKKHYCTGNLKMGKGIDFTMVNFACYKSVLVEGGQG
ncbi:MAG: hypothetical protein BGO09_15500 [Bacteroidetes bacterium 47-18]|nr:MAG: hypothetical protein BGO09_15500 [Bacteroidetes bacterium 47-18]